MQAQIERVAVALAIAVGVWVSGMSTQWTDWPYYHLGASTLFSEHGLHLYALHPKVQIGPVGLLPGLLPVWAAQAFGVALLVPALLLLHRLHSLPWPAVVLVGMVWPVTALHVQPADLLMIVFTLAAVVDLRAGRWRAGIWLGLAVAAKPTALPLPVMLFALPRRDALRALAAAGVLTVAAYAPFLADSAAWGAGHAQTAVNAGTVWRPFGRHPFDWQRPVQLLACLAAAAVLVRRGKWLAVVAVVPAVRLLLDQSSLPYQTGPVIVGVLAYELVTSSRVRAAWVAFVLMVVSSPSLTVPAPVGTAFLRVALIGLTVWLTLSRRTGEVVEPDNRAEVPQPVLRGRLVEG